MSRGVPAFARTPVRLTSVDVITARRGTFQLPPTGTHGRRLTVRSRDLPREGSRQIPMRQDARAVARKPMGPCGRRDARSPSSIDARPSVGGCGVRSATGSAPTMGVIPPQQVSGWIDRSDQRAANRRCAAPPRAAHDSILTGPSAIAGSVVRRPAPSTVTYNHDELASFPVRNHPVSGRRTARTLRVVNDASVDSLANQATRLPRTKSRATKV
jgi:hypothetical protein